MLGYIGVTDHELSEPVFFDQADWVAPHARGPRLPRVAGSATQRNRRRRMDVPGGAGSRRRAAARSAAASGGLAGSAARRSSSCAAPARRAGTRIPSRCSSEQRSRRDFRCSGSSVSSMNRRLRARAAHSPGAPGCGGAWRPPGAFWPRPCERRRTGGTSCPAPPRSEAASTRDLTRIGNSIAWCG